jgi:hypothetical protein
LETAFFFGTPRRIRCCPASFRGFLSGGENNQRLELIPYSELGSQYLFYGQLRLKLVNFFLTGLPGRFVVRLGQAEPDIGGNRIA